jgi:M6 family metalloprotease-like protein
MRTYLLITELVALLFLTLLPRTVSAAPPRPVVVTLVQPDGSRFQARAWGDEHAHGMETLDGYTIVLDPQTKYWLYAIRSTTGALAPAIGPQGNLVVGKSSPAALPKFARPTSPVRRAPFSRATVRVNTGTQKVLVILAQFSDQLPVGTVASDWSNLFFGATNSIKSYYTQVSYNQFDLAPAEESNGTANDGVVGWLTVPDVHPGTSFNDQFVAHAINTADPFVNFAAFDTNHDGYVSVDELHIAVVAAGYENAYVVSTPCGKMIWAHEGSFNDSSAPLVDGVKVAAGSHNGGYTTFGEIHCDAGEFLPAHPATIGIVVHELGHDLGLPDLYDTIGLTAGIGDWSIMGTGVWNSAGGGYAGNSPAHPDPWSRWYEGWLTPNQVTGSLLGTSIPQIETTPTVFQLLPNPNGVDWLVGSHTGTGEYFLVENRQKTLYDAGIPGCGVLIWHIDESVASNDDAEHRLVDLEQADGLKQLNISAGGNNGDAGDPYPGTTGNQTFDAVSDPSSALYSGNASYVTVANVSDCSATMSADVAYLPPPAYWYFFPVVGKQLP